MQQEIKKIFAGPFVGEFGWELLCWQGYIRYLAQNEFNYTKVCCRKGLSFLYEDFADDIIEYDIPIYHPDGERNFGDTGSPPKPDPEDGFNRYIKPGTPHIPRYFPNTGKFNTRFPQVFHKYTYSGPKLESFDFILHARSRKQTGTRDSTVRNLSQNKWDTLIKPFIDQGYTFGSIGSKEDALLVSGSKDLRGLDLHNVCGYLTQCKALVGPSSGPMHFGALCGTPLIVWSGTPNNKVRYEKAWNPFENNVNYIYGWRNVNLGHISREIKKFL